MSIPNFVQVNKFIFKKLKKKIKNVKHYFLQRFSNFNFRRRKKRDEKKKKEKGIKKE